MSKAKMIRDIMHVLEITRMDLNKVQRDEYRRKLNSLNEKAIAREWRSTIPEDMRYSESNY